MSNVVTEEEFRANTSLGRSSNWFPNYNDAFDEGVIMAADYLNRHSQTIMPRIYITIEKRTVVERGS